MFILLIILGIIASAQSKEQVKCEQCGACYDNVCPCSQICPALPVCYSSCDPDNPDCPQCGPGCSPIDQSTMRRLTADWEGPTCKDYYDRGCIPAQWKNETVDVCNWPGASCIDQTSSKAVASVTVFEWSAYSFSATRITGSFSASNLPPNIWI